MKLHEFQAKRLLADYGIPVGRGITATAAAEAAAAARDLGGGRWVVKAQIHAGGRGKGGGIKLANSPEEAGALAAALLGSHLITPQTDAQGQPIHTVLIEQAVSIAEELYLGVLVDRTRERIVLIASRAGGMDIEEVAAKNPEKIHTVAAHPVAGLQSFHGRQLAFALGLAGTQVNEFTRLAVALYKLYLEKDLSLVEINPLAITAEGEFLALDAKINVDDNGLYRQAVLETWRDVSQEDEKEARAREHGLNYVTLDGDIACMVNGAGLAMATMDLIKLHGGEPANFLDVGGGTTADKVAEAFRLILSDAKVKAILVNIFGGIVRCDLIAEGILKAARDVEMRVPLVVRLEGTNAEAGRRMLQDCGLRIHAVEQLSEAARKAVDAARGKL